MQAEINTLTSTRVPRNLTELMTLGRTLKRRAEHSSKQEDSGPNYTPGYEEPKIRCSDAQRWNTALFWRTQPIPAFFIRRA